MGNEFGFFWNSVEHDRIYDADSFSDWLKCFFTTGVFWGAFYVKAESGMDIIVQKGYCNIEGKAWVVDQDTMLTVPNADATNARVDSIMIERDEIDRTFRLKCVQGAPARNPVAPSPVRTNTLYQLVLAHIHVGAGITKITQSMIEDTRDNESICGYVAGTLKPAVWEQVIEQWSDFYADFRASRYDDFDAWFESVKGQLTTDAAGNLQRQIDFITGEEQVQDIAGTIRNNRTPSDLFRFTPERNILTDEVVIVSFLRNGDLLRYYEVKALQDFARSGSIYRYETSSRVPSVFLNGLGFEYLRTIPVSNLTSVDSNLSVLNDFHDSMMTQTLRFSQNTVYDIAPWFEILHPMAFNAVFTRKSGIVNFYIRLVITRRITNIEPIFTLASNGDVSFSPYDWVRVNISNETTDDSFPLAWLKNTGELQIWASSSKPLLTGTYYLSATYPAQEN